MKVREVGQLRERWQNGGCGCSGCGGVGDVMVRHIVERRQGRGRPRKYAGSGRCGRSGHGERLLLDQVRIQFRVSIASGAVVGVVLVGVVEELLLVVD